MKIVALVGSLGKESINKYLAQSAASYAPDGVEVVIADLSEIPFMNTDLESGGGGPEPVMRLRDQVRSADALLLVSPEYNHSITAVMKNTLEWLSRDYEADGGRPLAGKPAGIMTSSSGGFGGVRAAQQLQTLSAVLKMHLYVDAMVHVSKAFNVFDKETGKVSDENLIEKIKDFMSGYTNWVSSLG